MQPRCTAVGCCMPSDLHTLSHGNQVKACPAPDYKSVTATKKKVAGATRNAAALHCVFTIFLLLLAQSKIKESTITAWQAVTDVRTAALLHWYRKTTSCA